MTTINLRDFYPWYTHDEYIEVPDKVAEELHADKRYEQTYQRRARYHHARYSLDAGDGIEHAAIPSGLSLDAILDYRVTICDLCRALNSLPETQGRRVEAHYLLGKSMTQIAEEEGVVKSRISESIQRGLRNMKKYLGDLR